MAIIDILQKLTNDLSNGTIAVSYGQRIIQPPFCGEVYTPIKNLTPSTKKIGLLQGGVVVETKCIW